MAPVGLAAPTEALVEVGLAPVGGHGQAPGEVEPLLAQPFDELQLDVVPGEGERAGGGRRGDGHER